MLSFVALSKSKNRLSIQQTVYEIQAFLYKIKKPDSVTPDFLAIQVCGCGSE
jgi:hypothetical protein